MTKRLRSVKASIVMGILLVSVFVAITPTSSAGLLGLVDLTPHVIIEPGEGADLNQRVMPASGHLSIPINVKFMVSGAIAGFVVDNFFKGRIPTAIVDLEVSSDMDWATATITPNTVSPEIKADGYSEANANILVKVNENAPAMWSGKLKVTAHVKELVSFGAKIKESTFTGNIPFTPDYLPVISVKPQETFKEISPGETANFDIELDNLGNAKTEVTLRIINLPEGWSPNIASSITLGAGVLDENSKGTVQLVIQPPYNFGYHNDRETIQIEITPSYYADPTLVGRTYTETFTVQSRGFSTPGFETVLALFALASIAFIVKKRKQSK